MRRRQRTLRAIERTFSSTVVSTRRVEFLEDLGPGKWFYEDRSAYLTDNPIGQLVELGVTPRAFGGDAESVVIKDLVVEKYASERPGRRHLRRRWPRLAAFQRQRPVGTTARACPSDRKPRSREVPSATTASSAFAASGGEGSRIEGVEIAFNNYAGYNAGGKPGARNSGRRQDWSSVTPAYITIRAQGCGRTTTTSTHLYEGNIVFSNANDGIKHEISYDAIIRDNIVAGQWSTVSMIGFGDLRSSFRTAATWRSMAISSK